MAEQDIVRAITTFGAVVLGFGLGQVSEWIKSKKASRKKEQSLRQLINLETENNVFEIKSYWNKIIGSYDSWESENGKFKFVQLAKAAASNPFPFLSTDVWKANLGEVASVYSESELNKLWHFQKKLERLSSLYIYFSEARDEKNETNRFHGGSMGNIVSTYGFADSVRDHAPELKNIIEEIIKFEL